MTGLDVFHLTPGQPVADGVRAVAKDQLDSALTDIDADGVDLHESVHEARKRCKKVRALVRLVRDGVPDTYDEVNTELRDIARLVSAERDAAAFVETHDALTDALGKDTLAPFTDVRAQLVAHRDGDVLEGIAKLLPEVRERLATVRWQVDGWELPDGDGIDVLRAGYERTYDRARTRWSAATDEATTEHWHEWRKRVKYNRYHVNLLQEAFPEVMEQREDLLHDLTDLLGDDHDLAELRRALLHDGLLDLAEDALTAYVALLDGQRTRLQHAALPLATRLYGQPAGEHADQVFAWWRLAVDDGRDAAVDADDLEPVIPHGS